MRIHDRALAKIYGDLDARHAADATVTLGDGVIVDVLAAVADRDGRSGAKVKKDLLAANTKAEQLAIAKRGMSPAEKADLVTILDQGKVPMSPTAKNFLEALVGRAGLDSGPTVGGAGGGGGGGGTGGGAVSGLKVVGDQAKGIVGEAKAGAVIELIDLSNAPVGRLHPDDVFVAGKAGTDGRFTAQLDDRVKPAAEGNIVRLRARNTDGSVTSWLDIRLTGLGPKDTTNAWVAMFRIELAHDATSGKVLCSNNNGSRPLSEPGAVLQFTNKRTGLATKVTLDRDGQLPSGSLKLDGKPGDEFDVAASDGINNKSFAQSSGKLTVPGASGGTSGVDLPDPALVRDDVLPGGTPKYQRKRFKIPGNITRDFWKQLRQGNIGDCYLPAGVSAVAYVDHTVLQKAFKVNADGTATLTYFKDTASGLKPVTVTVDGDLYVRASGQLLYGTDVDFAILEKAYASLHGSYDAIGRGGHANEVMQALTGRRAYDVWVGEGEEATVWREIKKAVDEKRPGALGTHGDSQKKRYTNSGVYPDHAYTLIGYREVNGKKLVKLRNPWGESEPVDNGPNDGIFELPIEKVCYLFSNFMTVR